MTYFKQFSKKIIEWNDFVLKMRDIWTCEFILLGNHSLTYDDSIEKLKPYLNEKRKKKLAQCEKLMSLTDTLKLLNDMHIFDSFLKTTDE